MNEDFLSEMTENVISRSLVIPKEGVKVITSYGEESIVRATSYEEIERDLGTFSMNNGVIVFVDREGIKRVVPYEPDIIDALEKANYRKGSMFVPFSNGEVIIDEEFASEWKEKVSNARQRNAERRELEKIEMISQYADEKGIKHL